MFVVKPGSSDGCRSLSAIFFERLAADSRLTPVSRHCLTSLCGLDVPISEVWEAYENLQSPQKEKTIGWLLGEYFNSRDFARLAPNTRDSSKIYSTTIRSYRLRGGGQFESVAVRKITPGLIRRYLDSRAQDGSPVSANREIALLSTAWRWARERDYITQENPARQVTVLWRWWRDTTDPGPLTPPAKFA